MFFLLLTCAMVCQQQVDSQTIEQGQVQSTKRQNCCKVKQRKVIYNHDGGNDDYLALMLLLNQPHIDVVGIAITPADCYPEDAAIVTTKLITLLGKPDIPVSVGRIGGLHPFPNHLRNLASYMQNLPDLVGIPYNLSKLSQLSSHEFIMDILTKADDKSITILGVGPATDIAHALQICGQSCIDKIDEVVWMGGALEVQGNVFDRHHDGFAEWNAYWDPWSSQQLVRRGLNLTIFPLDVTNYAPLTTSFLHQLALQKKDLARLAVELYAGTYDQPFQYYMWDVMTTVHLLVDDLVQLEEMEVDFLLDPPIEAQLKKAPGSGYWARVALIPDIHKLNTFIYNSFDQDFQSPYQNEEL